MKQKGKDSSAMSDAYCYTPTVQATSPEDVHPIVNMLARKRSRKIDVDFPRPGSPSCFVCRPFLPSIHPSSSSIRIPRQSLPLFRIGDQSQDHPV